MRRTPKSKKDTSGTVSTRTRRGKRASPEVEEQLLRPPTPPSLPPRPRPQVTTLPPWSDSFDKAQVLNLWQSTQATLETFFTSTSLGQVRDIATNSWFHLNEISISNNLNLKLTPPSPPLSFIHCLKEIRNLTEAEQKIYDDLPVTGVVLIRLYPTKYQEKMLDLMFCASRYGWNYIVNRTKGRWFTMTETEMDEEIQPMLLKRHIKKLKMKISQCPVDCFDTAYREFKNACSSIRAASAAQKRREGQGFRYPEQLEYKSKKHGGVKVEIRGRSITYKRSQRTISFFPTYFGKGHEEIAIRTDLVKAGVAHFPYSNTLCMRQGHYYLAAPRHVPNQASAPPKVCALDPGVRTFMTGYDPEGGAFEISPDQIHLRAKHIRIAKLQSALSREKDKSVRTRLKQQIQDLYRRISNCVKDLHHKSAKILAQSYQEILLPTFESQKMSFKEGRVIGPGSARMMLTLSHYKFRQLLKQKMKNRNGTLVECSEEYSSKTCGACGRLNHSLGKKKVFICPYGNCRIQIDRDLNAARNILIKNYDRLKG